MKKYSYVGALVDLSDWILHPVANYKELHDYRNTIDIIQKDYEERKENFKKKLAEEKKKNENLKSFYNNIKEKMAEKDKVLSECNTKIVDLERDDNLKNNILIEIKAVIRTLEQKISYRDRVIETLRKTRSEQKTLIKQLEEQIGDARNQVLELAKKVEFYEKQAKKTPKEKVDYLMGRRRNE